jgi:hypothetical protein
MKIIGAYYLDEVQEQLRAILNEKQLKEFYSKNATASIQNFPIFINHEEVPPLLKVAWNMLNRGKFTRASLKLGAYLLQECFGPNLSFL